MSDHIGSHPRLALLQCLGKSRRDEKRSVDKSVHAVVQTGLRAAVQLASRLVHAFVPADVVELVDLRVGNLSSIRIEMEQ